MDARYGLRWKWRSRGVLPLASVGRRVRSERPGQLPLSRRTHSPTTEGRSTTKLSSSVALAHNGAVGECERVEGIEVPGTRLEFENQFGSETACRAYLERVRWPDGFVCPDDACGGRRSWVTARGLYRCAACGRQISVTAGTIFAGTRKPLRAWFEVLWLMTGKDGVSAEALQTALGLGSYQTAWVWLHKVRRAMALVAPECLTGIVELDVFP